MSTKQLRRVSSSVLVFALLLSSLLSVSVSPSLGAPPGMGDPRNRAESGQDPDQRPHDGANQAIRQILNRGGEAKAADQELERFQHPSTASLSVRANPSAGES